LAGYQPQPFFFLNLQHNFPAMSGKRTLTHVVIPCLTRNPVGPFWIPASAGMMKVREFKISLAGPYLKKPVLGTIIICIQADDRGGKVERRAGVPCGTSKRRAAADNEGIHMKANRYQPPERNTSIATSSPSLSGKANSLGTVGCALTRISM
jgi:hypothetical protein